METLSAESTSKLFLEEEGRAELRAFIEQRLEEHHCRLLRELGSLLTSHFGEQPVLPRRTTLLSFEPEEEGMATPKSFTPRQSYSNSQVEKKRSAKEVRFNSILSPRTLMRQQSEGREPRRVLARWVKSTSFELVSCSLILANAIFFGVEAQLAATLPRDAERERTFWLAGEAFTAAFTLELLLRVSVDLREFLCSPTNWLWNAFDATVVAAGLLELGLSIVGMETKTNLTHVRLIRVARTVRVLKVVRLLSIFASLRILVNSVLGTLRSLVWTLVLLLVVLYLFGLLFTNATLEHLREQAGGGPGAGEEGVLRQHFGTLLRSIYTLFQAITSGVNWAGVARALGEVHPAWEAIFSIFVMFIYFAVLNVVTGVFCQSAIESANQDKDTLVQAQLAMEKVYTEQLQLIFRQIDAAGTGYITLSMFEESLQDDQVKAYFDGLDLTTDDAWNLFKLLDARESNCLELQDFVRGCLRLRGRARSIDVHMLMHQSHWTMKRLGDVLQKLAITNESVARTTSPSLMRCFSRLSAGQWASSEAEQAPSVCSKKLNL